MKVKCKLNSYDSLDKTRDDALTVQNHWNSNRLVVLKIGNEEVTVNASDLIKAINNATNT